VTFPELRVVINNSSNVEISIYGEDGKVRLADKIFCEKCADIYFSLREIGFKSIAPDENMFSLEASFKQYKALGPANV